MVEVSDCFRSTIPYGRLDLRRSAWEAGAMTRASQQILGEIAALPDEERSELVIELARRVAFTPHDAPSDEDLISAAEQVFSDLDRRERS